MKDKFVGCDGIGDFNLHDSIPTEFRSSSAEGLLWPGVIGTAIFTAVFSFTDVLAVAETWMIGFAIFLVGGYWVQFIWRQSR